MTLLYGHKRRKEALVAILAALCLALAVTGYAQERRVRALTLQVSATYHKALYEAAELLGGGAPGSGKIYGVQQSRPTPGHFERHGPPG